MKPASLNRRLARNELFKKIIKANKSTKELHNGLSKEAAFRIVQAADVAIVETQNEPKQENTE